MKVPLIVSLLLASTPTQAQHDDPMPAPSFKINCHQKVTLSAGTVIVLESAESVQSTETAIGRNIGFKVKTQITAKGHVLIASGAWALGRVKAIAPATRNAPETITLELTSIQAVDGQMVALNGSETSIKGPFAGQSAKLEQGLLVVAHIANNTEIKVD